MCGRYVAASPAAVLVERFDVGEVVDRDDVAWMPPSYNVAPTDAVAAITMASDGHRRLGALRWGLVSSWASPPAGGPAVPAPDARRINARTETVATTRAFRTAFARRRCLLPADGFYEWDRKVGARRPWFVHRVDGAVMALAGIWEVWRSADGTTLRTCAILTTAASPLMAPIHDRMPVVLEPADWEPWLTGHRRRSAGADGAEVDLGAIEALLVPAREGILERRPVSTLVNSVRNNGPELIAPDEGPAPVPLALF